EVIAETYPKLHELLRPLSQDDIDEALCAWNGDMDSKRAVVRYMKEHGRDKDTAAWLSQEYGGPENKNLFIVRAGSPETIELPWPKVQRRIAQLIKEDRFFTEEERDNLDDIDPIAIRENLAQRGIVNGQVVEPEKLDNDPFIQQVMADMERLTEADRQEEPAQETAGATPATDESGTLPRDPMASAYGVGDFVFLENTEYRITDLQRGYVQLNDPALAYPIYRTESKEQFERAIRQDPRNSA
ncbi:DEAD/DEAH box helicase, partial [bacterium 1XD42-1]